MAEDSTGQADPKPVYRINVSGDPYGYILDEFQPTAAALPIIDCALERYSAERRRGF